jgi:PAS domain-containing protein
MKLTDQLLNHMENEAQLRVLIDLIQEFIVLKDDQGRWLVSNKIVLDMYELGGYDYVGKTDIELSEISPGKTARLCNWKSRLMVPMGC